MSGPLPRLVPHGEETMSGRSGEQKGGKRRERPHEMERRETMWAARNDESETQSVHQDVARRTTFPSLPSDEEKRRDKRLGWGHFNYWKQRKENVCVRVCNVERFIFGLTRAQKQLRVSKHLPTIRGNLADKPA